jgi:hypothetical protein
MLLPANAQPKDAEFTPVTAPAAGATQAADGSQDQNGLPESGSQPEQDRPKPSPKLKKWTEKWLDEIADSADFSDQCSSYQQDLEVLFPADKLKQQRNYRPKRGGAVRSRKENREVMIPRVYQNAQQSLAVLCPGDMSYRFTPKEAIPAIGVPVGASSKGSERDVVDRQFALTIDDQVGRSMEEVELQTVMREVARHAIWFRNGILKMVYTRDFFMDPIVGNRQNDAQEDIARLQYLLTELMRGAIEPADAEYQEILNLKNALLQDGQVEVWEGIAAENIPLNRFICDGTVRSKHGLKNARWMGDKHTLTGAQVLEKFPFKANPDGTWDGIHRADLEEATEYTGQGAEQELIDREQKRREKKTKRDNSSYANRSASSRKDKPLEERVFCVNEIWARCEAGTVFWMIDGVDYPLSKMVPTKRPASWFPYYNFCLNEQPDTWMGRSDTELQGPIQDRMNNKDSDQEKARWLSIGGRGIADVSQIDGAMIDKLQNLSPGDILKLNLQGNDINKALMWLTIPFNKEAFSKEDDEASMRLMHRMPAAQLGVTDDKTTATAIQTANAGSTIAFNDRQYAFNLDLGTVLRELAEMLLLEKSPQTVYTESGPNAVWPKVHGDKEAQALSQKIHDQVNQQVVSGIESAIYTAELSGQPPPELTPDMIDQQIAVLTEQQNLKAFGMPEPFSRESMFKRLQVKVTAEINGAMDRERRVQSITQLLTTLVPLGLQINLEPFARLLGSLMGEGDDMAAILKPDPNALVGMLQQIAGTDPGSLNPQSQLALAKIGQLAQAYLAQQQAAGALPAPGGGPSAGGGGPGAPGAGAPPGRGAPPAPAPAPAEPAMPTKNPHPRAGV